jgi:hypothetical protein
MIKLAKLSRNNEIKTRLSGPEMGGKKGASSGCGEIKLDVKRLRWIFFACKALW